jgi:hypothetical protein
MLVLKEFELDENKETFLSIKGRKKGFLAFILSLIGLDPIVELECSNREFLYKSAGLVGQVNLNIPVSAVTAIKTGFHKPLGYLVVAALAIIFGIASMSDSYTNNSTVLALIGFVVAVVCVIVYKKSKTMVLSIYNGGLGSSILGNSIHIAIKKCVIEDVEIDFDTFEKAAALLNNAVYELYANKK